MTYGVDQCRVCGVPIEPYSRETRGQYEAALRRPTMPEAEWRRYGFLAMPTKEQIKHPAIGCCATCGQLLLKRRWRPAMRGLTWLALFVSFGTFLTYVYNFARH
jgi:hypothetical protein